MILSARYTKALARAMATQTSKAQLLSITLLALIGGDGCIILTLHPLVVVDLTPIPGCGC